ncbi:MAG: pyridoxamine 5'-phosphate oxidase family protein [Rhodospirillaceae bacterium]|jgi:predicted pyridoxine 5'-phosphate oxidase superfamily flavin-nucleotide-binding protein
MSELISDIAFTPAVKAVQERKGSRQGYAAMEAKGGWVNVISNELKDFIADRNSFYLATSTADGQPYIQHRGGKKGFLKVLDERTLAFADFKGNRQYISTGNVTENDKAYIFLMDYANRRRIKIWGTLKVINNDPALLKSLTDTDYNGKPEQAMVFTVTAWDVNCPQHIPQLFDQEQVEKMIAPLQARIAELEARLQIAYT